MQDWRFAGHAFAQLTYEGVLSGFPGERESRDGNYNYNE
jgi:hypothetical protein